MGWEQIPLKPVSRSFLLLLFAYYPRSAELFVNILKTVSPVTVLLRPVVTFSQKYWMLHEYQSTRVSLCPCFHFYLPDRCWGKVNVPGLILVWDGNIEEYANGELVWIVSSSLLRFPDTVYCWAKEKVRSYVLLYIMTSRYFIYVQCDLKKKK